MMALKGGGDYGAADPGAVSSTGWRGDDGYSAETWWHRTGPGIVKELSDCRAATPTGYELI